MDTLTHAQDEICSRVEAVITARAEEVRQELVHLSSTLDSIGNDISIIRDRVERLSEKSESPGWITVGEDGAAECSIHGHESTRILDTSETGSALIGCRACDAAPRWVGV